MATRRIIKTTEETKEKNKQLQEKKTKVAKTAQKGPKTKKTAVTITENVKDVKLSSKDSPVANTRVVNDDLVHIDIYDIKAELERHKANSDILYGKVVGVSVDYSINKVVIDVLYTKSNASAYVQIVDTAYFEPTFNLGDDYNKLSEEAKLEKKKKCATYNLGSNCPFVVLGISEETITSGNHKGETLVKAVGARNVAMEMLRDKFFIHSNKATEPIDVNLNDQANANVIQVSEQYAVIECLGVEYRLDAYNLNERYVANCRDWVSVGDKIPVRFKKIRIEGNNVTIKVSGRLNLGAIDEEPLKIGGNYLGEVESYNESSKVYTCRLFNGAVCAVSSKATQGHLELMVGNTVSCVIKEYKEDYGYYYGLAMKI